MSLLDNFKRMDVRVELADMQSQLREYIKNQYSIETLIGLTDNDNENWSVYNCISLKIKSNSDGFKDKLIIDFTAYDCEENLKSSIYLKALEAKLRLEDLIDYENNADVLCKRVIASVINCCINDVKICMNIGICSSNVLRDFIVNVPTVNILKLLND